MRRCDNCKNEILFNDAQFCEHCGATLAPSTASPVEENDDFVVTESASDRAETGAPKPRLRQGDDLGLQSSAEMIQDLNRPEEIAAESPGSDNTNAVVTQPITGQSPAGPCNEQPKGLSPDQIKSIEKNLYASSDYLTEDEKRNLLKSVKTVEQATHSAQSSKAQSTGDSHSETQGKNPVVVPPAASKRGKGVAYYMKNYIQVRGDIDLRDNDEIRINDQSFLLRRKRMSPKMMLSLAASGFALCLVVIGSLLFSDPSSGTGQIVGVVLDVNQQPYVMGATIHLPDLGKSYSTNGQGFFRTERISPGSYRVEYVVNGQKVGVDYATVAVGEITTLAVKCGDVTLAEQTESVPAESQKQIASAQTPPQTPREVATSIQSEPSRPKDSKRSELSKIAVSSNIENARFSLDGNVIGAGNTTFGSLKPGQHSYVVSKDGYVPVGGSITLVAGEMHTIDVTLTPAETPVEAPNTLALAQNAVKNGDFEQAITLSSQMIQGSPDNPEPFVTRATANAGLGKKQDACNDYCRAAELFQGKNNSQAMSCYNLALQQSPKSIAALLARGNMYLDRGEDIAAIADFESVINLDKRNAIAFIGLGEARYNQGNHDQAIKYFKEARSLSPEDPYVYQYLMLAYLGDDDLKNVKKSYDKFMELSDQVQRDQLKTDRRFTAVLRVVANQ